MSGENQNQPNPENLQEVEAGAATEAAQDGAQLDTNLAELLAELDKARQDVLYVRAEAENIRRRAAEENEKTRKFAIERFARELLAVKDSLEMAMADQSGSFEGLKVGVDLTNKQLIAAFEKVDLQEINPLGEKLDPNKHQAISVAPSDVEANTVVQVMQKGYELSGRVIRPAMVVVSAPK
ncbi:MULTISPECIES: nucleotide exchange factor GrpE [Silvimonas]|uniref:nucleotide exchange factor GrpE n=1 Tax=Silvimonas TaxID=300264 RepID=UPI0024B3A3DC|nr:MULTISPECIES: nucleotide exchange factor GrpE [Silvimonas]MDR3426804.1 nucleotide exchange factor GrpE [Silvimonas sp.]